MKSQFSPCCALTVNDLRQKIYLSFPQGFIGIHNMLILLYKSLFLTKYPIYMQNMFTLRATSYNLRGNYILTLPVPKTTTYGLRSFSYHAANQWNSLPDFFRTTNFNDFKKALASLDFMYI